MTVDLPDFDDMQRAVDQIGELSRNKVLLDIEIKAAEADITRVCTSDPKYYVGGKPPSVAYIESTFKYTGFGGELIDKRKELAALTSALEVARLTYQLLQYKIDVWRSQVANERASLL